MSVQTRTGCFSMSSGPGLEAPALQGGQHDRGGGVRRQPEREHRHEGAGGGRVVGGLGAGDALDGAVAELLGVLGQLALGDVGQEGRDLGAAGRHGAEGEAERRCRAATASRTASSPRGPSTAGRRG